MCADITLRLCALGLGSAATGITLVAVQADAPVLATASFILAASSIFGLAGLKRKITPHIPFLANGAIWLATGGFLAGAHPVAGAAVLAGLAASSYKAKLSGSLDVSESKESREAEAADKNDPAHSNMPSINLKGEAFHEFTIGAVEIAAGEKLVDRIHLTDRVVFLRALSELCSDGKISVQIKVRLNKSGYDRVAHYQLVNLEMHREKQGVILCLANESEQTKAPEILENSTGAVADNNRFLTIVSHELRTPLNAIIGFSDVLRNDIGRNLSPETRVEYTDLIHGAGTHLLSLVNTILDVSKLDSGAYEIHREDFAFGATARDCIAMLSGQAKLKNVKINDRMDGELNQVNGDRRAIKQILINLLSNAIKYTHGGGFVTVDAHKNAKGLTFEVSDTGIGMQAHELDQIGKPFTQLDNSTTRNCEGTGLGLVLVKGLVELHGGKLTITSKKGVGTRVLIHIPGQNDEGNSHVEGETLSDLKDLLPHVKLNGLHADDEEISHGARKVG